MGSGLPGDSGARVYIYIYIYMGSGLRGDSGVYKQIFLKCSFMK